MSFSIIKTNKHNTKPKTPQLLSEGSYILKLNMVGVNIYEQSFCYRVHQIFTF